LKDSCCRIPFNRSYALLILNVISSTSTDALNVNGCRTSSSTIEGLQSYLSPLPSPNHLLHNDGTDLPLPLQFQALQHRSSQPATNTALQHLSGIVSIALTNHVPKYHPRRATSEEALKRLPGPLSLLSPQLL
jgi:hypothetical protein